MVRPPTCVRRIGAPQRGQWPPALRCAITSPVWTPPRLMAWRIALRSSRCSRATSRGVELVGGSFGSDRRLPQHLVGQQVPDAGDRVLVEQARLHRRPRRTDQLPEVREPDLAGVRAEGLDVGVEADPAEASLVEQPQRAAVGEVQGEPVPLGLDRRPLRAGADVVAALVDATVALGDEDAAAHAQVDAEDVVAGRLDPHRLAASVGGDEPPAEQGGADLAGRVRPADPGVGVVDVVDAPAEGGALDHGAG